MGPEQCVNIPRRKHIYVSDINSRVCHPSARHCAHCSVCSLFEASLQLRLWHRDGHAMLLAQGFTVKPGVRGWRRHLHGLKLALPCWHGCSCSGETPMAYTSGEGTPSVLWSLCDHIPANLSLGHLSSTGPLPDLPTTPYWFSPIPPDLLRSALVRSL